MRFDEAIKLAIAELERERRHLAMDAKLYATGMATYPHAKHAYERRERLGEAVALLSKELTG